MEKVTGSLASLFTVSETPLGDFTVGATGGKTVWELA